MCKYKNCITYSRLSRIFSLYFPTNFYIAMVCAKSIVLFATVCRMYIDSSIKCCPVTLSLTDEIYPTLYDDNIGRPQKHTHCMLVKAIRVSWPFVRKTNKSIQNLFFSIQLTISNLFSLRSPRKY